MLMHINSVGRVVCFFFYHTNTDTLFLSFPPSFIPPNPPTYHTLTSHPLTGPDGLGPSKAS